MVAKCSLQWITRRKSRGVAFLDYPGNKHVNIPAAFDNLDEGDQNYHRSSFDHWADGNNVPKNRFHGWPSDPDHSNCFMFRKGSQRLYGFLMHPFSDGSFQLCVLTVKAEKHKWLSDPKILDRQEQLKADHDIQRAISRDLKE